MKQPFRYIIFIIHFTLILIIAQSEVGQRIPPGVQNATISLRILYGSLFSLIYCGIIWINYQGLLKPLIQKGDVSTYVIRFPLYLLSLILIYLLSITWSNSPATNINDFFSYILSKNYYASLFKKLQNQLFEEGGDFIYTSIIGNFVITNLLASSYNILDAYYIRRNIKIYNRQAELSLLQQQIGPHFLYNALNTIYGLALTEGLNTLTKQIEDLSLQVRIIGEKRVDNTAVINRHNRTDVLTSLCFGLLYTLYLTLDAYGRYKINLLGDFVFLKIMIHPLGPILSGISLGLLSLVHFRCIFKKYFMEKEYKKYITGMIIFLIVFCIWYISRLTISIYLHKSNTIYTYLLNIGLPNIDLDNSSKSLFYELYKFGVKHIFLYYTILFIAIIYFISGFLYNAINTLVRFQLEQFEYKHLIKSQQKQAEYAFHQLSNLIDLNETKSIAYQSLSQLITLMQYVHLSSSKDYVSLDKEINFLIDYIEFQKKRLPDSPLINVIYSIGHYTPTLRIAPLLLISLIENAFKHGIQVDTKSFIKLTLTESGETLHFQLVNSKFPMTRKESNIGVGLESFKKRLKLLYDGNYKVTIMEDDNVFDVNLQLLLNS